MVFLYFPTVCSPSLRAWAPSIFGVVWAREKRLVLIYVMGSIAAVCCCREGYIICVAAVKGVPFGYHWWYHGDVDCFRRHVLLFHRHKTGERPHDSLLAGGEWCETYRIFVWAGRGPGGERFIAPAPSIFPNHSPSPFMVFEHALCKHRKRRFRFTSHRNNRGFISCSAVILFIIS